MPNIGEHIGNYQLVEVLASGTFGRVYRAEHTLLTQRQVAIKFLRLERLDKAKERNAFLQEAHFLDQLKHSALLPIIDVGLANEIPYIITEYAPNGTLRTYLKRQAKQPVALDEALRIMVPVSEALHYAHEHNIVHRDLKPENILFNEQNEPLLADFGIAVLLNAGTTLLSNISGTAPYMAPEQFTGLISYKSDQYALGCILYELLTGQRPFTAARANIEEMGYQHVNVPPIPPKQLNPAIPAYVEAALLKALAKERSERHPTVAAFLEALCTESPTPHLVEQPKVSEVPTQPLPPDPTRPPFHSTIILDPPQGNGNLLNVPPPTPQSGQINLSKETPVPLPIPPVSKPLPSISSLPTQPTTAWYKHPLMIVTPIILICLLIAGGLWPLTQRYTPPNISPGPLTLRQPIPGQLIPSQPIPGQPIPGQPTATIVITPASHLEQNSYVITAIPNGSFNVAQRQIPARMISVTSATQHATGNATGSIPARVASGQLALVNWTFSAITVNSTTLTGQDRVQVSFNGPIFVPAWGTVPITGFAVNPGSSGNIPALDIGGSCCASGITVNDSSTFTGGQDAIPNSIIRQSDINGAANPLVTALTQSTQTSLPQQIKANERVVDGTAGCTPIISADQQAGAVTNVVHVSVAVACHEEVYDVAAAQQMAMSLLLEQAQSDPALNTQYVQVGQIATSVLNTSIADSNNEVNLEVQAQGLWVYQFTPQIQVKLKSKLVKLSLQNAQVVLHGWTGIATVKINLSSGTTMPNNVNDISLTVQNIPGVQSTSSGTPVNRPIPSPTLGGS
ncbi:MAG: protein kinase domain-containing protein [Ktedonobacteraceae bacterium]